MRHINKILTIAALIFSIPALSTSFTPDHLEGIFSGDTLSEEESIYCSLQGTEVIETKLAERKFQLKFGAGRKKPVILQETVAQIQEQLEKHPQYLLFSSKSSKAIINISNHRIQTLYFYSLNDLFRIEQEVICTIRY